MSEQLIRDMERLAALAGDNGYVGLTLFIDPPMWLAELEIDGEAGAVLGSACGGGPTPEAALKALADKVSEGSVTSE